MLCKCILIDYLALEVPQRPTDRTCWWFRMISTVRRCFHPKSLFDIFMHKQVGVRACCSWVSNPSQNTLATATLPTHYPAVQCHQAGKHIITLPVLNAPLSQPPRHPQAPWWWRTYRSCGRSARTWESSEPTWAPCRRRASCRTCGATWATYWTSCSSASTCCSSPATPWSSSACGASGSSRHEHTYGARLCAHTYGSEWSGEMGNECDFHIAKSHGQKRKRDSNDSNDDSCLGIWVVIKVIQLDDNNTHNTLIIKVHFHVWDMRSRPLLSGDWKVAGLIPGLRLAKCQGVPEQDT